MAESIIFVICFPALCAAAIVEQLRKKNSVFVVWIGSGGAIPISNAIVRVPSFFFAGLWIPQVLSAVATVWFIQAFFGRLWLLVTPDTFQTLATQNSFGPTVARLMSTHLLAG